MGKAIVHSYLLPSAVKKGHHSPVLEMISSGFFES